MLNPLRTFFEGLPWLGVVLLLAFAGWRLGALPLALIVAALAAFCAATGLWVQTMATLYLCGVAAFIAALIGIPIGVLAARSRPGRETGDAGHRYTANYPILLLHHSCRHAVPGG